MIRCNPFQFGTVHRVSTSQGGMTVRMTVAVTMAAGPPHFEQRRNCNPSAKSNKRNAGCGIDVLAKPLGKGDARENVEAAGFSGRLNEISKFCKYEGNAWVTPGGKGASGWEEVPYWLKGFTDLGLILGDERLQAEAANGSTP